MIEDAPPRVSPHPARNPGLPRFLLPLSLVGVALIVVSILPAFVARRRLAAAERRVAREIEEKQRLAERVTRDRMALATDEYVFDRALKDLLSPGPTVAPPAGSEGGR